MKTFLLKFFKVFLIFCVFFGLVHSRALAADPPRVVRVGFYENKPKIFRDENNKVTGLFGDILDYIAQQENWQLSYVDGSFDEGLGRLRSGEIDIMVDVAFSDERAKLYDFNKETVFGSWGVIYVKKDSSINSFKALDGKRVALLKSSVYRAGEESIDRYIRAFDLGIEFVETYEYVEVFDLLSKGEVDAAIVSRISGLTAEKDHPDIKATDIIFNPTELRFALTKNDVDNVYLVERLDFWIKRLHEGYQGIYPKILEKHGLAVLTQPIGVIPLWLYPAALLAIIVIIFSWFLIIGFRRARSIALRMLARKEWYLGKVMSNIPVLIATIDKEGVVIFSEGKTKTPVGTRLLPGSGNNRFELTDVNETVNKHLHKALSGQEAQFDEQIGDRVYHTMAYPLMKNGEVQEVTLISIDITEENLLKKAKKDFIYVVQHQLRTPPTVIKWSLELLSPKIIPHLKKTDKENWNMLGEANERMINLANTISRISEMESGMFPIKVESIDLPELINEILINLNKPIETRKLKVKKDLESLTEVMMDKIMMEIILQTLISNAVYYSVPKGLVSISAASKDNSWVIKVSDTGIGIPQNLEGKLYAAFSRGHEASQYYPEGVGMGLYTTKTLLDSIEGKIWYESEVGKGSTFYVEIPKKIAPRTTE